MKKWTTRELICTGMLAAVAGVLMSFEFSVPMMPPFYKVDFSDVPSMIALFLLGPAPAACVEIVKVLIKLFTVGTNSMYVGEFASLVGIGLFVIPMWLVYKKGGKSKRSALGAMAVSVPVRVAFSCFCNAFITLPMYAAAMELPMDEVIAIVAVVNPAIHDLTGFIVLATIPFNVIKIAANCGVAWLLYERLSRVKIFEKAVV
ncbi:MAG: ECF transporter S component [Lachnospiraceae bacterium]|nr:ECF transporter S component [Lachnospiraceae bacterium]